MYQALGHVKLKTGEKVSAGVVLGPDLEWADRLEKLLHHKGDHWNWQNSRALRSNLGIEPRFYLLHRAGTPFANILTSELAGVGILGHVWTNPQDRQKGACSSLMGLQTEDFRSRNGSALFLGTGFDSPAYHIYRRFGFRAVEPKSGFMEWYATSKEEFESAYYAPGETEIQPIGWAHWPSSSALYVGNSPCVLRCAPLRLIGRCITEGPLLPLLREEEKRRSVRENPRAVVLCNKPAAAVVGLTVWDWHPLWQDVCLVDIFCHPNYWDEAAALFRALELPQAERYVAYSDANCQHKSQLLSDEGFEQTVTLKRRVPSDRAKSSFLDVAVYERDA